MHDRDMIQFVMYTVWMFTFVGASCSHLCNSTALLLDTLLARKEDGNFKLLVYPKKHIQTNIWISCLTTHYITSKESLGLCQTDVIMWWQKKRIVDKKRNTIPVPWSSAIIQGCPVQQDNTEKRTKKASNKKRHWRAEAYVKGLSKEFTRILKTYRICTAVKPHTTLMHMLAHPKNRINDEEKPEVIYKISCKNCEYVYVWETGRLLGEWVSSFLMAAGNKSKKTS